MKNEIIRFIIVGVLNTIIGTLIMFITYNFFGFNYWTSSSTAYFLASIFSFYANNFFTFKNKDFQLKAVIKFIINIVVCYTLAYSISKPIINILLQMLLRREQIKLVDNIAMLFGMILFTGFNFIGQKFFAFKAVKIIKKVN